MKILIVAPYFYPKVGGLENYVWHICHGLKDMYGLDIVAVASNHETNEYKEEVIDGIKIYRLPVWFKLSNTPINFNWFSQIKEIIKKEQPDIINAHSPVPFISDITAMANRNIPYVLTYHSGSMKKSNFLIDFVIFLYEKYILSFIGKKAIKIICVSEFVKNKMFAKFVEKVTVITPGVDNQIFKPNNSKSSKNTILFIANQKEMYELKGLNYLIKAVENIPNSHLRIIGEKQISFKKNITYVGYKNLNDLVSEIQRSSVIVLPSVVEESFGMVLIEAMACKKPVIGTRTGGIPEVIDHNINGIIVPPKNYIQLNKAIVEIITNKKKSNELAKNGYKKSLKYNWKNKVNETFQIYKNI